VKASESQYISFASLKENIRLTTISRVFHNLFFASSLFLFRPHSDILGKAGHEVIHTLDKGICVLVLCQEEEEADSDLEEDLSSSEDSNEHQLEGIRTKNEKIRESK
jgi:hypothetical protein